MTLFCEASGAGPQAQEAVAWVLRNRRDSGRWGHTLAEVCLHRMQFSEWNADPADNRNLLRAAACPEGDPTMVGCKQVLESVLASDGPDPTHGALFYFDHSIPPPAWAQGLPPLLVLGPFSFFRDVR